MVHWINGFSNFSAPTHTFTQQEFCNNNINSNKINKITTTKTSGQSIWQQAASLPHMDGSVVFVKWRQCAPHLIYASLGPPESSTQMAFPSVQSFLHSSQQSIPILYSGPPFPPQNCPLPWGIWTPSNSRFLGPTRAHNPNSISIG